MNKKELINEIVQMADYLDQQGLSKEADVMDGIMHKVAKSGLFENIKEVGRSYFKDPSAEDFNQFISQRPDFNPNVIEKQMLQKVMARYQPKIDKLANAILQLEKSNPQKAKQYYEAMKSLEEEAKGEAFTKTKVSNQMILDYYVKNRGKAKKFVAGMSGGTFDYLDRWLDWGEWNKRNAADWMQYNTERRKMADAAIKRLFDAPGRGYRGAVKDIEKGQKEEVSEGLQQNQTQSQNQ